MNTVAVLHVLQLLEAAGLKVWVDGGWGIDALIGRLTRAHNDLDIAVSHIAGERLRLTMLKTGYRPLRGTEQNFVLQDEKGHEVDVHLVDLSSTRVDDSGAEIYGPLGLAYEVGSLTGRGMIGGRAVHCLTAEFQIKAHTRYEPDADDFRDMAALHKAFGMPLPPPYSS